MKNCKNLLAILLTSLSVIHCAGDDDGVARVEYQGQVTEARINRSDCYVQYISAEGVASAVACYVGFRTFAELNDTVTVSIDDLGAIYNNGGLDQWIPINVGPVNVLFEPASPIDRSISGGNIRFTQISNVVGDRLCYDLELNLYNGQVDLSTCARIR